MTVDGQVGNQRVTAGSSRWTVLEQGEDTEESRGATSIPTEARAMMKGHND